MKYISIDTETTGLDEKVCQLIEFGAVFDNLNSQRSIENLPSFHAYVAHDVYQGDPYALAMNQKILHRIATREEGFLYLKPEELVSRFLEWAGQFIDGKFTVAGKNFGRFDSRFLDAIPDWRDRVDDHHRSMDVGSMFIDFDKDEEIPNLKTCLERAGIVKEISHTAVEDAIDVVHLVRYKKGR